MYQSYSGLMFAYVLAALIGLGLVVVLASAREELRRRRKESKGEPLALESRAEYFAWLSSQDGPRRRY